MTSANWDSPSGAMSVQHHKCWDVWKGHQDENGNRCRKCFQKEWAEQGEGEGNEGEDGRGESSKYER